MRTFLITGNAVCGILGKWNSTRGVVWSSVSPHVYFWHATISRLLWSIQGNINWDLTQSPMLNLFIPINPRHGWTSSWPRQSTPSHGLLVPQTLPPWRGCEDSHQVLPSHSATATSPHLHGRCSAMQWQTVTPFLSQIFLKKNLIHA